MPATLESASARTKPTRSSGDLSQDQYRYLLVVVLVVAAVLRFWHIGTRGLWYDEAYSWNMTQLSWRDFFTGLSGSAVNMSLYYFILKFWVKLGQSEFALRSLSAIFSVATLPVLAELAKRLYSRRTAIIAVSLFAVHTFVIRYAQEARSYALVTFLVALGWLQLLNAIRKPNDRNWLIFALISITAVYAHLIAGLNVVAQMATLVFVERQQRLWRPIFRAAALFVLGVLPALVVTFRNQQSLVWVQPTGLSTMRFFLDAMAGRSGWVLQCLLVLAIFTVASGLFLKRLLARSTGIGLFASSVPVVGFAFPIAALVAVSWYQPTFVPRYLVFVTVPLVLGLAVGCAHLKPKFGLVVALVLVILLAVPLRNFYREPSSQDFRGAVQYIQSREQAGDLLLTWEPLGRTAVDYYGRLDPNFPRYTFPPGKHLQPNDVSLLPDPYVLPAIVASHKRIWIVYTFQKTPLDSGLIAALYLQRITERTHKLVSTRDFRGLRVEEYALQ